MADETGAVRRTVQNIRVGGHATGIVQIEGDGNIVSVLSGTPAEVRDALLAIQAALATQPATKALTDAAVQQANADSPDKAAIGAQLSAALDIAKTTLGWAEVAGKLAPAVGTVARWLGGEWADLLRF